MSAFERLRAAPKAKAPKKFIGQTRSNKARGKWKSRKGTEISISRDFHLATTTTTQAKPGHLAPEPGRVDLLAVIRFALNERVSLVAMF